MMYITDEELAREVRRRELTVRRKNRRKKRIRAIIVTLVIIAGVALLFTHCSKPNYDDSESFEKYAVDVLDSIETEQEQGDTKQVLKYGEVKSSAVRYPENISAEIDQNVKDLIAGYRTKFRRTYADYDNPDTDKFALFVTYDSVKPQKKIIGTAFRKSVRREKDKEMVEIASSIDAHNYLVENGVELSAVQVFETGYKEKLSKLADEYLKDKYGDKLKDGYRKYISDRAKNFENFLIKEDSILFYFASGTVVPDSEGVVTMEFTYSELKGIKREKINLRALDPNKPMVAITFDDGPASGTSDRILDCLEKNDAVATFFELGECIENVKTSKQILQRQQSLGCETGGHSYSHVQLTNASAAARKKEVALTNKLIRERIGHDPTVFRPPYGATTDKLAKETGLPNILWSVDTLDWKSRNAASVVAQVKKVSELDGKVILMHSIYESTAEAVETIVPWLKSEGYQLVTVSELIQYKYGETPVKGKLYGYNYFYLE